MCSTSLKLPWNISRNVAKYYERREQKIHVPYKGPASAQIVVIGSGSPGDPVSVCLKTDTKQ